MKTKEELESLLEKAEEIENYHFMNSSTNQFPYITWQAVCETLRMVLEIDEGLQEKYFHSEYKVAIGSDNVHN